MILSTSTKGQPTFTAVYSGGCVDSQSKMPKVGKTDV